MPKDLTSLRIHVVSNPFNFWLWLLSTNEWCSCLSAKPSCLYALSPLFSQCQPIYPLWNWDNFLYLWLRDIFMETLILLSFWLLLVGTGWGKSDATIKFKLLFPARTQSIAVYFMMLKMATLTHFQINKTKPPLPVASIISYSSFLPPYPFIIGYMFLPSSLHLTYSYYNYWTR